MYICTTCQTQNSDEITTQIREGGDRLVNKQLPTRTHQSPLIISLPRSRRSGRKHLSPGKAEPLVQLARYYRLTESEHESCLVVELSLIKVESHLRLS
jgi:hypothetical protein